VAPNTLINLYRKLRKEYGDPINYWPQWCANSKSTQEREKIIIGMVLVQRTTWHNANIALKRLRDAHMLTVKSISQTKNLETLTEIIRPAGFFQSKPKRLFDVCSFVQNSGGVSQMLPKSIAELRQNLLNIKGVGNETADTILLYALDKPIFIIDEYTYRWLDNENIQHSRNYNDLQEYFHNNLKRDAKLYRDYHTLIIVSQRGQEKSKMEVV
jgi:endonuclease-3 related protein